MRYGYRCQHDLYHSFDQSCGKNHRTEYFDGIYRNHCESGRLSCFSGSCNTAAGILRNFLYYSEFAVHRSGIRCILKTDFSPWTKSICRVSAVNYIDRRQNLISSIFGLDMAFIQCTGYGKARKKEALLIPAGTERSVDGCVKLLRRSSIGRRREPALRFIP